MSHEFQARLRATREVRRLEWRERWIPVGFWLAATATMVVLILMASEGNARWYATLPLAVGAIAIVKGLQRKDITDFTLEGREEVKAARQLDRQQLAADTKKFFKSWFGRLLISGAVVAACFLYAQQGPTSSDERVLLLLLCAGAAIWAWQTSLALLACGLVWWLTTLDWHISTPTAVIIGAVIIAGAIQGKK
jgi:hypothetical protein